jgi:hypothetical protein
VVPFSPLLEAIRLPIVVTASMVGGQPRDAGSRLFTAVWNAAHPSFHTIYEQISGKDYLGRPMTLTLRNALAKVFPGTAPHIAKAKQDQEVGPVESITTKAPIAFSAGFHEYYQSLRDQGIGASQALAIVKGLFATVSSGITGIHAYEAQPKPEPKASKKSGGGAFQVP